MKVVGIVGKEGGPSRGLSQTWYNETGHGSGQGVFISELKKKLKNNMVDLPVVVVADFKQEETIEWFKKELSSA